MKKYIALVFIVVAFLSSHFVVKAQFKKGSAFVGVSGSYSSVKEKLSYPPTTFIGTVPGPSSVDFLVTAKAGYFLFDSFALGVGVQGANHKTTYDISERYVDAGITLSPLARYYVYKGFYLEAMGHVGQDNSTSTIGNLIHSSKARTKGFELLTGYTLLLNRNVAIEPLFSYRKMSTRYLNDVPGNPKTAEFFLSVALQLYLFR